MFYINTIKKLNSDLENLLDKFAKLQEQSDSILKQLDASKKEMLDFNERSVDIDAMLLDSVKRIDEKIAELTRVQDALVLTHHNRALLDGTLNPKKK